MLLLFRPRLSAGTAALGTTVRISDVGNKVWSGPLSSTNKPNVKKLR